MSRVARRIDLRDGSSHRYWYKYVLGRLLLALLSCFALIVFVGSYTTMSSKPPVIATSPVDFATLTDYDSVDSKAAPGDKQARHSIKTGPDGSVQQNQRMESVLGDAVLRLLRIRKGPKLNSHDPNAIATQPSIWDSENIEEYKALYIHPQWENWAAFDSSFLWTWKEEDAVRHKVDWKIMVWVCIMFAALNIDR
jgi:hypothetical protein